MESTAEALAPIGSALATCSTPASTRFACSSEVSERSCTNRLFSTAAGAAVQPDSSALESTQSEYLVEVRVGRLVRERLQLRRQERLREFSNTRILWKYLGTAAGATYDARTT